MVAAPSVEDEADEPELVERLTREHMSGAADRLLAAIASETAGADPHPRRPPTGPMR